MEVLSALTTRMVRARVAENSAEWIDIPNSHWESIGVYLAPKVGVQRAHGTRGCWSGTSESTWDVELEDDNKDSLCGYLGDNITPFLPASHRTD